MILYHMTPKRNLESILNNGLLPGYSKGLYIYGNKKLNKVYLTNNVLKIVSIQSGYEWIKDNDVIILEIDIDEKYFEPCKYEYSGTYTYSDFEFVTDIIKPEQIKKYYDYKDNSD